MKKSKSVLLWLLAFLLTLFLAFYQRMTGPTYPLKGKYAFYDIEIKYKLYRSWTSYKPLPVRVAVSGKVAWLNLFYTRFPVSENKEIAVNMKKRGTSYEAEIPGQPAAGKVAYRIQGATQASGAVYIPEMGQPPVVARFKGELPAWLLIVHIIAMFAGMLLAFRTGLGALLRDGRWQNLVPWVLGVTVIGGMIIGPFVQKYAFGAFWTGFPLGGDLTDSKTLFIVLIWLGAFFFRKKSRWWVVLAAILMVAVYLIPHSMQGSELDYKTGQVVTAK
jgi:hypothetical protein